MTTPHDPPPADALARISSGAAVTVFGIGALVLTGWIFDIAILKNLSSQLTAMQVNSAVAFMLTGVALWLVQARRAARRPVQYVAWGCAVVVAVVGLLTLAEYAFGWSLGIDHLTFLEPVGTAPAFYPGRMAPNTAFVFLLVGLALLLLDVQTRRGHRAAQYLIALVGIVSGVALVGYVYGASVLYTPSAGAKPMSLPTALAGILAFVGLLFARPDAGLVALASSKNAASVMARRFLFPVLLVPLLVDFLLGAGQRAGLYGATVAAAAHAAVLVGIVAGVALVVATLVKRAEAELDAARRGPGDAAAPQGSAPNAHRRPAGFVVAIAVVAAATLVRLGFLETLGTRAVYVVFYPAVVLASLYGGLPAGLLATALSGLAADYFWIEPRGFGIADPADWLSMGIFLGSGALIAGVAGAMHRAQARARAAEAAASRAAERERSAEQLRELSQRLTYHVDNSPLAVIEWGPDMRLTRWSDAAEKIFGWKAAEVLGKRMEDFRWIYPEDAPQVAEVSSELQTGTNPRRISTNRNYRKGGSVAWCEWYNSSLLDASGQVRSILSLVLDVTERKQAEEALRLANEELEQRVGARTAELQANSRYARSLLEASLDPLVTISPDGRVTDVNRATELATGVAREQLIGTSFSDYCTAPEAAEAGYQKVLAEGFVRDYPLTIRHISGRTTDVLYNATVYRDEAGAVQGVFAAARDVTERNRIAAELARHRDHLEELVRRRTGELETANAQLQGEIVERRRAEEQLRLQLTVLQSTANALVITDRAGVIQWVNAAFSRLTGYSAAEAIGQNPRILKSGRHDAAFYREMWETILAGRVWHGELIARRKDGSLYPEEMTITPVVEHGDQITHFIAVKQDITVRKQAEEELQRMAAELAHSNEELQQFAYVASHDLQEPLRAVSGYLSLIDARLRDRLDDKSRYHIAGAIEGAGRMHKLITDLLALSRVGTQAQAPEPVDLNVVLDTAVSNLAASMQGAGARITRDPLPRLTVDAGQMTQVFQNLIGNAIKFRGERPPEIHVGATRQPDGTWRFSVRDNGIGIEPQYFERIFLVFQRLHTRKEYPGTGIGLAICKKIIERHGGRIWLESQPGQGSTFFFNLSDPKTP